MTELRELRINAKGKVVMVFGDLHAPYHHKDAIAFITAVKKKYKPAIAVCTGDEADKHGMSFHESDPDLDSAGVELKKNKKIQKQVEKLFPKLYIADSNHGSLIYRRAKSGGLPRDVLKSLSEIYCTPKWYWHPKLILDTYAGIIGIDHQGTPSYGKRCKEEGCSWIQGHHHTKFEITWHKSSLADRFNAFAGCLVDRRKLAFAYGRTTVPKAILGSIIIDAEGEPHMIRMRLKRNHRWDGRI